MKFRATLLFAVWFFAALPLSAQSADAAKPADRTNPPATASTEKKKPKRVWTNDEIGSVKGAISVVGDGSSPAARNREERGASSGPSDDARQQQIDHYREQIESYQAEIDSIDKRINQLKNFKAENTSPLGGININQGYNMVPLEDQIKQLEAKKKQLQSKIEDTEVEARKNGIDSGDLRR
jgi:chromosome segregation ATPase